VVKASTYLVKSLVSGMKYSTHTILLQIYSVAGDFYTNHRYKKRGCTIEGFQQGGAHHSLREVASKRLEGLLEILAPGFSLQGLGHQF
jgi:hypothetical protein